MYAPLHCPYFGTPIPTSTDKILINKPQPFRGLGMPIDRQAIMLMRGAIIHLHTVLACARHHLPTVKLQGRDGVFEAMRLGDLAGTYIPYPNSLVQGPRDNVLFVELEAGDGGGMASECPMGLSRAH